MSPPTRRDAETPLGQILSPVFKELGWKRPGRLRWASPEAEPRFGARVVFGRYNGMPPLPNTLLMSFEAPPQDDLYLPFRDQVSLLTKEEQEPLRQLVEQVRRRIDRTGAEAREMEAQAPGMLDDVASVPLHGPPGALEYLTLDDLVVQARVLAGLLPVMIERLTRPGLPWPYG